MIRVAVVYSTLLLHSFPTYDCVTLCVSILLLMGVWTLKTGKEVTSYCRWALDVGNGSPLTANSLNVPGSGSSLSASRKECRPANALLSAPWYLYQTSDRSKVPRDVITILFLCLSALLALTCLLSAHRTSWVPEMCPTFPWGPGISCDLLSNNTLLVTYITHENAVWDSGLYLLSHLSESLRGPPLIPLCIQTGLSYVLIYVLMCELMWTQQAQGSTVSNLKLFLKPVYYFYCVCVHLKCT